MKQHDQDDKEINQYENDHDKEELETKSTT